MRVADDRSASASSAKVLGTVAVAPAARPRSRGREAQRQGNTNEMNHRSTEGRATVNLLYDVLPGEVAEQDEEPNPLPLLGGCGQALITAAEFFVGRTTADEHLEGCSPCREVLITLGRRASGIE